MVAIHVKSTFFDYDVIVGRNIIDADLSRTLEVSGADPGGSIVVVTDDGADKYFPSMPSLPRSCHRLVLKQGEHLKTFANSESVITQLAEWKVGRDGLLVAFGGGVIGDLTGFVASIYLRGIAWIAVPTTLLSQVDSSIGGKVAVNLPAGKNLVGAFYPPRLVVSDITLLSCLPESEFISGLGEVVKTALIGDPHLFEFLEQNLDAVLARDLDALEYVVSACAKLKAEVVSQDERDTGERAILNFGHTIAHAIEGAKGFEHIPHGIAVLNGILVALKLSENICGLQRPIAERIRRLIERLPIDPAKSLPPVDLLESFMVHDKKVRNNQVRWVLLKDLGQPVTGITIPMAQVQAAYKSLWDM
jgi:3-dehydroquinate synthase